MEIRPLAYGYFDPCLSKVNFWGKFLRIKLDDSQEEVLVQIADIHTITYGPKVQCKTVDVEVDVWEE